jgi:hypothetical protein
MTAASVCSAQTTLKMGIKIAFPSGILQSRSAEPPNGGPSDEPANPAKYHIGPF